MSRRFGNLPNGSRGSSPARVRPATTGPILEFCARHGIEAMTGHCPMSEVNEAVDHLRSGRARYRIELDNG